MRPCFQITSSKLEAELLFRDEEDYIYGINTLALILLLFPGGTVYAFVLMSNHIHLVLGGPKEECEAYYDAVMHRLSLWLRKKYGLSGIVPYGPKNRTTVTVKGLEHFTVEVRHNQLSGLPTEIKFSDQELAARVRTICQNELKVDDHRQLPNKELLRLCRTLAIRYGSSPEQLQRVVGVDKTILEDPLCASAGGFRPQKR